MEKFFSPPFLIMNDAKPMKKRTYNSAPFAELRKSDYSPLADWNGSFAVFFSKRRQLGSSFPGFFEVASPTASFLLRSAFLLFSGFSAHLHDIP
jgi:hypothetical protein